MKRDSEGVYEPDRDARWPSGWTARGIIELFEPLVLPARAERIRATSAARIGTVTVLLDGPQDPHNGAAVLRSAEAFGLAEVHVVPRGGPFLVSERVTQGADRWLELRRHESPSRAADALIARGFVLVATHPDGDLDPRGLAGLERCALVMGNERSGISPELCARAAHSVRVPMRGMVESLNLSVSAAILLAYATEGRAGDLGPAELERSIALGLFRTVDRAAEVLAASSPR